MNLSDVGAVIDGALDRVDNEHGAVTEKLAALEQFETGVREIQPASSGTATASLSGGGAVAVAGGIDRKSPASGGCTRVRDLFLDTVGSCEGVTETESVTAAMCEEFSEDVALALAPENDPQFTTTTKRATLSATQQRQTELDIFQSALERERDSLNSTREWVTDCFEFLETVRDQSLLATEFETLCEYHEQLSGHRERCGKHNRARQELLRSATGEAGAAGLAHESVVGYLYGDRSHSFPVLVAVSRLDAVCRGCQRRVRDHLTRRV